MRHIENRICIISLCLLLAVCCSCSSGDDPYGYPEYRQNNGSNLNMKGEPLRPVSNQDMARIQHSLQFLGYDPGPVNGCCGPKTRNAIKKFQIDHGLPSDGSVGPLTEESMRKAIHARGMLQSGTSNSTQYREASLP